ncbi:unnamed protein product [Rotaria sp. Silwood1]|nr:unnamed protein product [Rotaria sp. Silwood1]
MLPEEEQCFYAISYLIAHLRLYRNETLVNLYAQTTTKHQRELELPMDYHVAAKVSLINHSSYVQLRKTKIIADRLLIDNLVDKESSTVPVTKSNVGQISAYPVKKYENLSYEDIFLTKQILFKLACSISDLAENEYEPYHVKYKVMDRFVRLCTKLTETNIDLLLCPIVQCLHSKFYLTVFNIVNLRQPIFDPRQSFFIREYLFKTLKEKNTLHICEKLHTAKDDTIHFTSQNLAIWLNQEEVDEIQDTYCFTKGYLYYIKNTLDQPNQTFHGIQLESTLKTFGTISQNENVQEEIVNDEQGIQLLAECVCDSKLDEKTVQQLAMRIIFMISFVGERAIEKIKEIDQLMENIVKATTLTEISKERTAKRMMWNLENEQKFIEQTIAEENNKQEMKTELIPSDYQGWDNLLSQPLKPKLAPEKTNKPETFDLMISYCHAQRDICHRLYDYLMNDQFHVWIDKENMYGSVLESMAEVIERSDVVLMCMSTKYKESNACKLEATYVWKRKKKAIPIKVEEKYEPTG